MSVSAYVRCVRENVRSKWFDGGRQCDVGKERKCGGVGKYKVLIRGDLE